MSTYTYKSIIALFLLSTSLNMSSQAGDVEVKIDKISQSDNNITIQLLFNLDNLELKSRDQRVFTPVIKGDNYEQELLPLVVNGDTRHKVSIRQQALNNSKNNFAQEVLRNSDNGTQEILYASNFSWKSWMSTAKLYIREESCLNCSKKNHSQDYLLSDKIDIENSKYKLNPILNFVIPPSENNKKRVEKGSAYLKYRFGASEMDINYQNNITEISKIYKILDHILKDENLIINNISLTGFSSIEGLYATNLRLAEARAKDIETHLLTRYSLSPSLFSTTGVGEDWDGLYQLVKTGDMKYRDQVLTIIQTVGIFEGREKQLMDLKAGVPYHFMVEAYFPKLRKVDYLIDYSIPEFAESETDKVLSEHPEYFSCREYFLLADKYGRGSDKFCEIIEQALSQYPNNPAMNLNISTICTLKGAYKEAEEYALKSGNTSDALNNLGVIYMLQNDLSKAESYLAKAKTAGCAEATHNIAELNRLKNKL